MHLSFGLTTYDRRLNRVREKMREYAVEGLVVTMPDCIHWLTGFDTIGYLWTQALIFDAHDSEPVFVTRTSEQPGIAATSQVRKTRVYDISVSDPAVVISEVVESLGLERARVGIDLQAFTLTPYMWEQLQETLPQTEWQDASMLIPETRLIKEPIEIEYQRQAAEMADYAMNKVLHSIRPGISETELAGIASHALGEAGSEYAAIPPMVVSGERTVMVHALADRRCVGVGDLVCIELAGVVNRYHAVLMRTAYLGKPPSRVSNVADCLQRSIEASFAAVKLEGAVSEPDHACNDVLAELDLVQARCHRIGYSLGVAYPPGWLEPMTLVDGDEHTFAPGMSFTIEPNISLPHEGFGMKLGETVRCTSKGIERLSQIDTSLFVIDC